MRQAAEIELFNSEEEFLIPDDIDFDAISNLTHEVRSVLKRDRPRSLVSLRRFPVICVACSLVVVRVLMCSFCRL